MLTTKNFVTFSKKCYMRVSIHETTTTKAATPPPPTTTTPATTTMTAAATTTTLKSVTDTFKAFFHLAWSHYHQSNLNLQRSHFLPFLETQWTDLIAAASKSCNSLKMWNVSWVFWQHLWHLLGYNCEKKPLMFELIGLWNSRALGPPLLGC